MSPNTNTSDQKDFNLLDDVKPITTKTLNDFWVQIMIPHLDAKFVSKEEFKEDFEKYDVRMSRRFTNMEHTFDEKLHETNKRLEKLETGVLDIQEKLTKRVDEAYYELDAHAHAIRQIRGLADRGKEKYVVKKV